MTIDINYKIDYKEVLAKDPQTILCEAAEIIKTRGWIKGDLEDAEGAVCAIGALYTVVYGNAFASPSSALNYPLSLDIHNKFSEVHNLLTEHIKASGKYYSGSVASFNDAEDTTLEDVLSAFVPEGTEC